jgi:hypothetical protein
VKLAPVTAAILVGAAAAAVAPARASMPPQPGPGKPQPPQITQLVVFKDGTFKEKKATAHKVAVRLGRRRCEIGAGTPLAALVVSRVAKIGLHDYGTCSSKPRDAAGLFVRKLGTDANAGQDGWVYKVGHKSGTAGAADPTGAFGHGKLHFGAHVLWFYCQMQGSSCQRTLSFDQITTQPPGGVEVKVSAYNDRGKGIPAAGVTVHVDSATGVTDANGIAHIDAGVGTHTMYADGGGYIRSFDTPVELQ